MRKIIEDKKEEELMKKELNQAAEVVVQRINDKLRGTEFPVRQTRIGQSGFINRDQENGDLTKNR